MQFIGFKPTLSSENRIYRDSLNAWMHLLKNGKSPSRLFVRAVKEYLRQVENEELLQAINAAYDEPPSLEEEARLEGMRRKHRQLVEG